MYSLNASKKNVQSIKVNMLPSYLHLAEEATLYMSQYDVGLYKYYIQLFEKNRPYYLTDFEDKKDSDDSSADSTDETTDGTTDSTSDNTTDENTTEGNTEDNTEDGTDNTDSGDSSGEDSGDTPSEDEKPVEPVRVYVQGLKPDNKVFRYETSYYGNIVYLPERDQITNVPGTVKCEVIVLKGSLRKTSELFYINVEKSLIQDAYKVSQNEVVKLANEEEAEYIEPENSDTSGDDSGSNTDDNSSENTDGESTTPTDNSGETVDSGQ